MKRKKNYSSEEIKEIAKRVYQYRSLKQISQRKLGEKIHIRKDVIQRIESGNLKSIDENLIRHIAMVLDCNADYLLLKSDDSRNPHTKYIYQKLPEFAKTADGFLFSHNQLFFDMEYIAKYMHSSYQQQLLDMIHTFVVFHKASIHYPNITEKEASSINSDQYNKILKSDFFAHQNALHQKKNSDSKELE